MRLHRYYALLGFVVTIAANVGAPGWIEAVTAILAILYFLASTWFYLFDEDRRA